MRARGPKLALKAGPKKTEMYGLSHAYSLPGNTHSPVRESQSLLLPNYPPNSYSAKLFLIRWRFMLCVLYAVALISISLERNLEISPNQLSLRHQTILLSYVIHSVLESTNPSQFHLSDCWTVKYDSPLKRTPFPGSTVLLWQALHYSCFMAAAVSITVMPLTVG